MRALILTSTTGVRFGCVVAFWDQSPNGVTRVSGVDGFTREVVETPDEIANALDALHVLDEEEAKERVKSMPMAPVDQGISTGSPAGSVRFVTRL